MAPPPPEVCEARREGGPSLAAALPFPFPGLAAWLGLPRDRPVGLRGEKGCASPRGVLPPERGEGSGGGARGEVSPQRVRVRVATVAAAAASASACARVVRRSGPALMPRSAAVTEVRMGRPCAAKRQGMPKWHA